MIGPVCPRFDFPPLSVAALEALIAGDRAALEAATGATFPEPLAAPPLMDDALTFFRDTPLAEPEAVDWWGRWIVIRETGEVVGSIGFMGRPDADSAVTMGYSVYPSYQRQGIASEAAKALVAWAVMQPEVRSVRATIKPGHVASQRVAAAAGLRRTDRVEDDPDEGKVEVWERARE
jgi:ribosomal-protein-alanine N-acetyltransferase